MFGNKSSKPQNRIDCLIGAGTDIEGNITFSGGLRVDGHVRGNVIAAEDKPGTLVLSEQARIEGEIRVSHVVINGTVVGPVHAAEYVELQAQSQCHRGCALPDAGNAARARWCRAGWSTRTEGKVRQGRADQTRVGRIDAVRHALTAGINSA